MGDQYKNNNILQRPKFIHLCSSLFLRNRLEWEFTWPLRMASRFKGGRRKILEFHVVGLSDFTVALSEITSYVFYGHLYAFLFQSPGFSTVSADSSLIVVGQCWTRSVALLAATF